MFNLFSVDILIYKKISFSYLTNRTGSLILHTPEIPAAILFDRTGIYGHCSGRFIPVPETGPGQNRMLTLCQERGVRHLTTAKLNVATWSVVRPTGAIVRWQGS